MEGAGASGLSRPGPQCSSPCAEISREAVGKTPPRGWPLLRHRELPPEIRMDFWGKLPCSAKTRPETAFHLASMQECTAPVPVPGRSGRWPAADRP